MVDRQRAVVPLWTLGTEVGQAERLAPLLGEGPMTVARVDQLRSALAAFDSAPLVTLEAHPLPTELDLSRGMHLDSASPLATHLADLMSRSSQSAPLVMKHAADGGEMLYRMVVPAKVAAEVGRGFVRPMASKAVAGGVHSALVGGSGIAAQASFVPVAVGADVAAAGAAAGAAGAAGAGAAGVAGAGALTVAAPLVLLAVAIGISAHADHQRQVAIARITDLVEKLHLAALNQERDQLNGCVDAVESATAILLDRGQLGHSLGLDTAVATINTAIASATRRTGEWRTAVDKMSGTRIEIERLHKAFDGIETRGGKFRVHLELAALAIALKRRVLVLQAVEHSQISGGNEFAHFTRILRKEQAGIDQLESKIANVLADLGGLRLGPPSALKRPMLTRGDLDAVLTTMDRLRELKDSAAEMAPRNGDLVIDIARRKDGSIVVFPATASA
jgi:hypothetical protein